MAKSPARSIALRQTSHRTSKAGPPPAGAAAAPSGDNLNRVTAELIRVGALARIIRDRLASLDLPEVSDLELLAGILAERLGALPDLASPPVR